MLSFLRLRKLVYAANVQCDVSMSPTEMKVSIKFPVDFNCIITSCITFLTQSTASDKLSNRTDPNRDALIALARGNR